MKRKIEIIDDDKQGDRFGNAVRKIVAVPKKDVDRQLEKERKERKKKKDSKR